MQTTDTTYNKQLIVTLVLLCIGYFIDFYDLTIFSACYSSVIKDLFHITDNIQVQKLYLTISNFYTLGIILGSITFGILGDKYGRSYIIRYSILIYSVAIILSTMTKSTTIFTILRFISGFGLATEFATSSVLIAELLNTKKTTVVTKWLYISGILGGVTALYIGHTFSWRAMFLLGGISGLILYKLRKQIVESKLFLLLNSKSQGNIMLLFNSPKDINKIIKLFILIVPFNFVMSAMFMFPSFMPISFSLEHAIGLLLFGYFAGNIVSTFLSSFIVNYFKDYRSYLWLNIFVFLLIVPSFIFIGNTLFFIYAFILGLVSGGLPTIWIQMINKEYPTNIRSTASNTLYAMGRISTMVFNLLFLNWVNDSNTFVICVFSSTLLISVITILVLYKTPNTYKRELQKVVA